MSKQIILDDREYITIKNTRGEVTGGFYWNPADLDIVKRCEKVSEFFSSISAPETLDEAGVFQIADDIKNQFDYLLGEGAAAELFKHCNPLSPRPDGKLYAVYLLEIVLNYVKAEINDRVGKMSPGVEKYAGKYAGVKNVQPTYNHKHKRH